MAQWETEFHSFLELILGAAYGSKPFWVAAGIAGGALLIFGWLITNFVFSAKRGFIVTLLGQIVPGAAAIAGWIAVTIYAVPELSAGPVRDYLPLAGAVLAGFLATMIISRFIFGISEGASIFAVILTYVCVAGAIFLGGTLVKTVDSGMQNFQETKEQRDAETDSLLGP